MMIQEIEMKAGTETSCPMVHISIDGSEYMIIAGQLNRFVSILTGRWIRDRRALGKTFWNLADIGTHYKKHGRILLEYANQIAKAV